MASIRSSTQFDPVDPWTLNIERSAPAARAANAWPLLVRTGKGARTLEQETESCANVLVFDSLAAIATYLINSTG